MKENLKRDLKRTIGSKISTFEKQKEQIMKHSVSIDVLSGLVLSLEEKLENLKEYNRDSLIRILSTYYSKEQLNSILDKLEIARLVLNMKEKGHQVEFNEEELNILIEFLESTRAIRDNEIKKFEAIAERDIKPLEYKIDELKVIEEKISLGENGLNIINRQEVDEIMQLVIEENSDDELQISILRELNKINIIIHSKIKTQI